MIYSVHTKMVRRYNWFEKRTLELISPARTAEEIAIEEFNIFNGIIVLIGQYFLLHNCKEK